jgi:transposase-like protein
VAPHRSFAKANNPYWSNHDATWYAGHQDVEEYCRRRDISTASFMLWARHLLSREDLRKRKERLRNSRLEKFERQGKKARSKQSRRSPRYRYGVRTDSKPIALRAFWSMHIEAMNFSGMGQAEYAAALGLSPHALRIWRDRLEESGDEMDWRSLLHPSARAQLRSAANCARREYRLTEQAADGRSNRRRFSDEQKRTMVQEIEKPGVAVARVCRRHGIATSLLFRWRVQFVYIIVFIIEFARNTRLPSAHKARRYASRVTHSRRQIGRDALRSVASQGWQSLAVLSWHGALRREEP